MKNRLSTSALAGKHLVLPDTMSSRAAQCLLLHGTGRRLRLSLHKENLALPRGLSSAHTDEYCQLIITSIPYQQALLLQSAWAN